MGVSKLHRGVRDKRRDRVNDASVPCTPKKAIVAKSIRAIVFSGFLSFK
jgi:hypothetical protein